MFNAVINTLGDSGRLKDYYGIPARDDSRSKKANFDLVAQLLSQACEKKTFTARLEMAPRL